MMREEIKRRGGREGRGWRRMGRKSEQKKRRV
jgi:hypothetical protein